MAANSACLSSASSLWEAESGIGSGAFTGEAGGGVCPIWFLPIPDKIQTSVSFVLFRILPVTQVDFPFVALF